MPKSLAKILQLLTLLCPLSLFVAGCGSEQDSDNTNQTDQLDVIRIVPWGPKFVDFIDWYVGEEQGFFAEAGIKIEQRAAEGAGDAVRYVVAGNADIAMADPFSGFFAIQRGAKLQGLYCPYTKSWMTLVVNETKGILSPQDLKGRTIAVTSQASTSRYATMFFLAANGLSEDDVTMASVGRDFASVLLGGSVDAASTWDSVNWAMFRKIGTPEENGFKVWRYEQMPGPNEVYFAREEWAQSNPDLIQRFLTALEKSKQWIEQNPEGATEIAAQYALGGDDLVRNRAIVDLRIAMQSSGPGVDQHGVGWCDTDTMSSMVKEAVALGILDNDIDVNAVFADQFVNSRAGVPE